VVLDNFSAGVMQRLNLDHAHLSAINPGIVTCSISGFGQDGPNYLRPAFDQVIQGIGGGMSITGDDADHPTRAGIPIGDLGGGMFAVMGILAALQARGRKGCGQHVDISMLDCQISMLGYMATMHLISGENPEPLGNAHFVHVPYNTYRTADGFIIIAVIFDSFWDNLVALLDALINVIETSARRDGETYTRYAAQLQSLKNNRKRAAGELEGLRRSDAVRQRAQDETRMWAAWRAHPERTAADKTEFDAAITTSLANNERDQVLAQIVGRSQLLRAAVLLERLRIESAKPDAEREPGYQQRDHAQIEGFLLQVQRRYAPAVEKALLGVLIAQYQALPDALRAPEYDQVFGRTTQEAHAALERLYAETRLGEEPARLAALSAILDGTPPADALLAAAVHLVQADLRMEDARKASAGELLRLRPRYMSALEHWRTQQGRALYPDANGTLRVSYGRVEGLTSHDAIRYAPVSTVAGIVEKNTGHAPFNAPAPLLNAIARGHFGSTTDPVLGTQPVNFLTNLDTTGGNSGSPVLNAQGQLVGLNFDSNWESVSASWWFDPRYKRAIHVDMRYFRWLLDTVYPAPHLLREMGL